ncbi:Uncharacterised protein [Vibrio cholerae]|uniref:Uncharacterized protein n=1 Tax=Vibrio cholerae TaxID=666 RepID=A0A655WIB0_VIBCL|nr:Uncharacterised protein [Vibrio cholerae]CSB89684.1 Uncharacterised protein [Vibrio cholerae]
MHKNQSLHPVANPAVTLFRLVHSGSLERSDFDVQWCDEDSPMRCLVARTQKTLHLAVQTSQDTPTYTRNRRVHRHRAYRNANGVSHLSGRPPVALDERAFAHQATSATFLGCKSL